jgi:hypothetical protein
MLSGFGSIRKGTQVRTEAVALYASASQFESPDPTPEGVPPKGADFSCFLPGKKFFHDFSPIAPTLRGFVA